MKQQVDMAKEWYVTRFELFQKSLNGEAKTPVHRLRKEAIAAFEARGFPTKRDEEWRFIDLSRLARTQFAAGPADDPGTLFLKDIDRFTFGGLKCARLVFVNGRYSRRLSVAPALPKGVRIGSLAHAFTSDKGLIEEYLARHASYTENPFTALNTAFLLDGAFLHVPDGVVVRQPIHLLFVSTEEKTPFVTHPRSLIIVGKNSRVSLAESFVGLRKNVYFTNAVTEMILGESAVVEHDKLQAESDRAYHFGTIHVHQGAGSVFTSNSISFGGALVRNTVNTVLDDEGIETTLNGLALATGEQLVDNHTAIDHAKPHCNSHELYKSILDGRARGVFNGKIFVRQDAQKTDAKQTNRTLLLSDDATMDAKPQLEIFADDVKCTHGATVGHLDEEQVFYLRTRGIPLDSARDILTFAFAGDIINRVHVEPLRQQLDRMMHRHLQQGRLVQD
jgi:Fe-S cluster assembly protein SufD